MKMLLLLPLLSVISAEEISPPSILLNSDPVQNRSEAVLTPGSAFSLSCHGNASLSWSSNAFKEASVIRGGTLQVFRANPRHTGTYRCAYTNSTLKHLHATVHLYIKDPSAIFVTQRNTPSVSEGEDFLFRCLLTDPSFTNLTLRMVEDRNKGTGHHLPLGMNVSADPRVGVTIHKPDRKFNGRYVCTARNNNTVATSATLHLMVMPKPSRPQVLVNQSHILRIVGESFAVTCVTSSSSMLLVIFWTYPDIEAPNMTETSSYSNGLYKNSTLSIATVGRQHSGRYTCTARNNWPSEDSATATLRVLDAPFVTAFLQRRTSSQSEGNVSTQGTERFQQPNVSNVSAMDDWMLLANISVDTTGVHVSRNSTVDVHEGGDVTLIVVLEAYPPISSLEWTSPHLVKTKMQSCTTDGYRCQASLLLRRVRDEEKGRYTLRYANARFSGSLNFDLRVLRAPGGIITLENDTLICRSSGFPPPIILWSQCSGLVDTCGNVSISWLDNVTAQEGQKQHIALPQALADDVTFECVSINSVGHSRNVFYLPGRSVWTAHMLAATVGAAMLLLLVIVLIFRIRRQPKYEVRWKIIESFQGNNYTFVDPSLLPYNNLKWEFPRDKLRLGGVLGSGAFGKVVEATAYGLGSQDETRVAVKMLKPSAHSEEREALMCELKILSYLGYHDNIVNLLGACTQGGPMLMITEYCFHGDLLNFLRTHAQHFVAAILSLEPAEHDAKYFNIRLRSDSGISCCSEYQEMQPMLSSSGAQQSECLSMSDLMRFSYQVAQGLDFLSTRNCIHRDVAARNVLLSDRHVAKICDFGLARDIRNDDSYIVQGNARLPVKWMAPESIFQCVYTVQSDVWSYGVLLWEIFSLGKSPYPNVAVDTKFYKMIKDGCHMDRPDFAPPQMYQLMTSCWSLEPTDRPTFKIICQLVERLLLSDDKAGHGKQPIYKNIDERGEDEDSEEEDGMGEDSFKGEEPDSGEDDEESIKMTKMTKNIYQLS
nr:macrophage colony-stimulating factor 1 receptor 2-like [Nerophis lumbriciformis]